ncbi:hypothetical protein [Natrinema salsiterrestre]|uniref:Protein-lysine N-methyltransferase n=1 Tax=Natrinema salsiterrestre TaxID=2950540 RepID=A0A9Q4Q318_9EURY|nr:hypothetical protein [Natrinema salsiterrestre]MDF9747076.1 protein-lysine N-methyltransferase [Natrinema salsiterrestre]
MSEQTASQTTYQRRLDDRVTALTAAPDATVADVIRNARGAFPTIVYDRLRERGVADTLPTGTLESDGETDAVHTPELHPLDYEWYFTAEATTAVADSLREGGEPILCLGAPTVAVRLARRGVPVTLVDRSGRVEKRFATDLESLRFVRGDVHEPLDLESTFSVAFFDPPWYPEHTEAWLYRACQHVRPGGRVQFVLFPPLVRPSAAEQRRDLLETARRVGTVSVDEDAVAYRTPAFERRVLRDSDVPVVSAWRRADLASVDVADGSALSEPPTVASDGDWQTFVAEGQVVKLREDVTGDPEAVLAPIEGCEGYVLPSVSRRDARRQNVDLWTSRNRVAKVGNRAAVAEGLRLLETGATLSELSETEFITGLSAERKQHLVAQLDAILESQSD